MSVVSSNKVETNKYEIEISVDAQSFNEELDKAFKKNNPKISIPGFRKGHAPRAMVEKMYGEGVFFEDAINALYPAAYQAAVEELKIEPVDRADIEVTSRKQSRRILLQGQCDCKARSNGKRLQRNCCY